MNIKKVVKITFFVLGIILLLVAFINTVMINQIKENNETKYSVNKLVFVQENMHELLKESSLLQTIEDVETYKKRFVDFELKFEELKKSFSVLKKSDFLDNFIDDIHEHKDINEKLVILFNNEKKIEKAFDKLYELQKEEILLSNKFNIIYPKESSERKNLQEKIIKHKDYALLEIYSDVKYYSKETLYQYRDKKSLNTWLNKIEELIEKSKLDSIKNYKMIVEVIGNYSIRLNDISMQKNVLKNSIIKVINENKNHSLYIKNKIERLSADFISKSYFYIVLLLGFIFLLIIIFGFKVYKNVGLSVDEIEHKVKKGLEEIKNLNNEIENTQKEVVFTMGSIGESRSKETGNHVKRVAEYSKLFALKCGLSKEEAELLKQASPMHDIGKVAIPDAILNKPGRFEDDEREIMNTHALLGYEMLKHSNRPILKAAAIVAKEHHEKWDGSGYPNKIKGENIHIYGRITAIADVFDALGSDRCYKKAWDDEKIFNLFKEEKGRHFDPKLIDIFFENLDEFKKIRDSLKDTF